MKNIRLVNDNFLMYFERPAYEMEWDDKLDNLKPKNKAESLINTKKNPLPTHKVIKGSGSNYLSNEIFYRVALMRERWQARNPNKPKFPTGHFHVAMVQAKIDIERSKKERKFVFTYKKLDEPYSIYDFNKAIDDKENFEKLSKRNVYVELSKLIKTVEETIGKTLNNFYDLF